MRKRCVAQKKALLLVEKALLYSNQNEKRSLGHVIFLEDTHARGCTTTGEINRKDAKNAEQADKDLCALHIFAVIFRAEVSQSSGNETRGDHFLEEQKSGFSN